MGNSDSSHRAMDEALAVLAATGAEFGPLGLSNHGPMAAEAMCALGRGDQVMGWVERYRSRLEPRRRATDRIDPRAWREALGRHERIADWQAFFAEALQQAPWREVLNLWINRLAPGISAAAYHGLIRTAHAVRTLASAENPARLNELAAGLGDWPLRIVNWRRRRKIRRREIRWR